MIGFFMKRNACLLIVATLAVAAAQSQPLGPMTQQWVQRFHAPGTSNNVPNGLAVDKHGNVFVTGYETSSNGTSNNLYVNYLTLKYSPSGVPQWTNYVAGPTNPFFINYGVGGIALDRAGNVFVTSKTTIAYSNDGLPLWTNDYPGEQATAIAVDPSSGSVYVSGISTGVPTSNSEQYVTIKYSNTGSPLWTNSLIFSDDGAVFDKAFLALGNDGTAFVAGLSQFASAWPNYVTVAYSSHGTPLWTNGYNGPGNGSDSPVGIAVDKYDNVFVTGASTYLKDFDFQDTATIAYSVTGTPLWTNDFAAYPSAIAVNDLGDVFVTGNSEGVATIAYSGAGVPLWTNQFIANADYDPVIAMAADFNRGVFVTGVTGYPADFATLGYSSSGVPVSTNLYNGPANGEDVPQAIAVGPGGDVYVTGYSTGTNNGYDFATIKYSPTHSH